MPPCCTPRKAGPRCVAESPGMPTPRGPWSCRAGQSLKEWHDVHARLASEAAAFTHGTVIFGDSITERLRGTKNGVALTADEIKHGLLEELPRVLAGAKLWRPHPPLLLGIGGDQTQQLLWRLQQGELERAGGGRSDVHPWSRSASLVLHIGTNNLGWGMDAKAAADGVLDVAAFVLNRTRGPLLVSALLPRDAKWGHWGNVSAREPAGQRVAETNARIARALGTAGRFSRHASRLAFTDCGPLLGRADSEATARPHGPSNGPSAHGLGHSIVFSDGLHPTAEGYVEIAVGIERSRSMVHVYVHVHVYMLHAHAHAHVYMCMYMCMYMYMCMCM